MRTVKAERLCNASIPQVFVKAGCESAGPVTLLTVLSVLIRQGQGQFGPFVAFDYGQQGALSKRGREVCKAWQCPLLMWRLPEIGVPPNHPFEWDFPL